MIDHLINNMRKTQDYHIIEFYSVQQHQTSVIKRKSYLNGYIHWEIEGSWFRQDTQDELEKWYQKTYGRKEKLERILNGNTL